VESVDNRVVPPRRYFDKDFNAHVVNVTIGGCVLSSATDEMLVTVLGSCVSACVRDPVLNIGGMNHFMLPGRPLGAVPINDFMYRYGHFAMEKLMNDLFIRGAKRERLEIKLYGGARLLKARTSIGDDNISFVRNYLKEEGFIAASEDLGGLFPRRVNYFPATGRVFRLLMRRSDDAEVFNNEISFRAQLRAGRDDGSTTLFGKDRP
jgi:chemotaxis protein CheD